MPRLLKTAVDFAAYLVVRLAVCVLQALPIEACPGGARRGAWLLWHLFRLRRNVIEENLAIALPAATASEREAIGLAMWEHLLVMLAEIAQAPRKLHRRDWPGYSRIPAMDPMVLRLLDLPPLVILSGHPGNLEMGG